MKRWLYWLLGKAGPPHAEYSYNITQSEIKRLEEAIDLHYKGFCSVSDKNKDLLEEIDRLKARLKQANEKLKQYGHPGEY